MQSVKPEPNLVASAVISAARAAGRSHRSIPDSTGAHPRARLSGHNHPPARTPSWQSNALLEQLRTRCRPGAFDLVVVVNTGERPDWAIEICDEIRRKNPEQSLLLMTDANVDREYRVSNRLELLLERVEAEFGSSTAADSLAA